MNSQLRAVLIRIAKNAVNASLTALGPVGMWHAQFNFSSFAGVEHVLMVMGSAAVARELMIFVPLILKWSSTDSSLNGVSK